jgi:hypothetical protein
VQVPFFPTNTEVDKDVATSNFSSAATSNFSSAAAYTKLLADGTTTAIAHEAAYPRNHNNNGDWPRSCLPTEQQQLSVTVHETLTR